MSELETLGQSGLSQPEKDEAHSFTVASFELVGVDIDFYTKVLKFNDNILTSRHWVIVLVPPSDLVLVNSEQPRNETDEVNKLLGCLARCRGEVSL